VETGMRGTYPPISDYGIIGAMHTCALVSRAGSIDWFCLPSFDSPAVFGRILDWRKGGHFQVAPKEVQSVTRRYLPGTNVLETTFRTETGVAKLTDFMPVTPPEPATSNGHGTRSPNGLRVSLPTGDEEATSENMLKPLEAGLRQKVVRILECTEGSVEFAVQCRPRFDYGTVVPHVALVEASGGFSRYGFARGGGNAVSVYCSSEMTICEHGFHSEGALGAGEKLYSAVTYQPFFVPVCEGFSGRGIEQMLDETVRYWEQWSARCDYDGEHKEDILRSALTLKALTYEPSGALLAAATTSLPEEPAGGRNWDYRFTWIRDATFALGALHNLGYTDEARAFKRWLEWSAAYPEDLQIMYGLRGERHLPEFELPLEGYKWSTPVRVGNGAADQFQLDIYGEILDSAYIYREVVVGRSEEADYWEYESETDLKPEQYDTDPGYWEFLSGVVEYVIDNWRRPDAGLWESRGGYRHFVYSKVMCWVALDRGIKIAEELVRERGGPERYGIDDEKLRRWAAVRDEIKQDVLDNGYDPNYKAGQGAFVQSYGSKVLDASNLRLVEVGFIEADEPRMSSTIDAIRQDLMSPQGFVYRYKGFDDGLAGSEGTFTICTFWLISNLIALGELGEARAMFETLRGYANDLGLFSEEINEDSGEMLGNFPQAFSHLAFIDVAVELARAERAAVVQV